MRWLNIDMIRQQLRIDGHCEDVLLEMYGESAEETLLNYINRTYAEVMYKWKKMPVPLVHASLMLVDNWYQYRSPVSQVNMSVVPYAFDVLVKPYVRLADPNASDFPRGTLFDSKGKALTDSKDRYLTAREK